MNLVNLFPTSIGVVRNKEMADAALSIAKRYLSDDSKITNKWNYKNTYSEAFARSLETAAAIIALGVVDKIAVVSKFGIALAPSSGPWIGV